MKRFSIKYAESVTNDTKTLTAKVRSRILDRIESQLSHEPTKVTRNRKIIKGIKPPWDHQEPIWELRVDDFRVFYDVDEESRSVVVRAIRQKPPHKTTEEIL